jgi:hypothetical protein
MDQGRALQVRQAGSDNNTAASEPRAELLLHPKQKLHKASRI